MVTSEMIARKQGVGDILFNALAMAQYETVYATIIIIGALGFVIDVGFERLRAHLVAWAEPTHRSRSARHDGAAHLPRSRSASCRSRWCWRCGRASWPPAWRRRAAAAAARGVRAADRADRQPAFLENAAITLYRLFAGFSIAVSSA